MRTIDNMKMTPAAWGRGRNYILTLLMVIMAFSYTDRFVLSVMLEDIKLDLRLSDTQLGLLSGIAFALFYSVMGIPIARWADRGNRVTIISVTSALWSLAVVLCGVVGNFAQLLAVRVAVAVGEAGCIPSAHSFIADHFSRAERPRAVARYMLGLPLALIMGYFAGGWLNQLYGWRLTFVWVGLPGIALALLAASTLGEPRKGGSRRATAVAMTESPPVQPDMTTVFVTLWANETFRHMLFAFLVWYFFGYGLLQWQPTFFIRSHGLASGELGIWLAAVNGVGSLLGTWLGGELSSRYAANNERLQLLGVAAIALFAILCNVGSYVMSNYRWAFAIMAVGAVIGNMGQGPILATMQSLVAPPMRAVALAIVYLFANLLGMGLGPLAAGALSDALRPWAGAESLRYALLAFCPGFLWVAWHFLRASQTVTRDVELAVAARVISEQSAAHPPRGSCAAAGRAR